MNTNATEVSVEDIPPTTFERDLVFGSIKRAMKGVSSRDLWNVSAADIDKLHVMEGLNVRLEGEELDAHIRYLADSMQSEGFKQSKPIEVFVLEEDGEQKIYVADGHCRLKAVKLAISEGAEIVQIPAVTLPTKGVGLEDIVVGLVRSNTGKPLTPFETALVCKRLTNYGWNSERIGERLGYGPKYIEMLLEAVSAPMSIVTMIQKGEIAVTTAVEALRKHGSKAPELLKNGLAIAQANGKKAVTKAYLPGAALEKVVKLQATPLFNVAKAITADPAFGSLSSEVRASLNELLEAIDKKEKAVEAKLKSKAAAEEEPAADAQGASSDAEG